MRIGVATDFAYGVSIWRRLHDEGTDVRVWISPRDRKSVGDGIVHKAATFKELQDWVLEGDAAGEPSLLLFDSSGLGDKAEEARKKGIKVVGGGEFCDRLEKDRAFGQQIAEDVGILIPSCREFASISDCCAEVGKTPGGVYFKTDRYIDSDATHGAKTGGEMQEYLEGLIKRHGGHGKTLLQEKIEGTPISTARWWNGSSWVGPYECTIENKKFMNDNVGPSTGAALNAVWFYQEEHPAIAEALNWEALAPAFRKNFATPGLYDINAIATKEGEAFFLEWTPRFGWDSEPTSTRLMPNLSKHLWAIASGLDMPDPDSDIAFAIKLSVPPYPWEFGKNHHKGTCDGTPINGIDGLWAGTFQGYMLRYEDEAFVMASPEGLVGLALAKGDDIEELNDICVEFAKEEMRVPGMGFRTDGDKIVKKDAKGLNDAGFKMPKGVL